MLNVYNFNGALTQTSNGVLTKNPKAQITMNVEADIEPEKNNAPLDGVLTLKLRANSELADCQYDLWMLIELRQRSPHSRTQCGVELYELLTFARPSHEFETNS